MRWRMIPITLSLLVPFNCGRSDDSKAGQQPGSVAEEEAAAAADSLAAADPYVAYSYSERIGKRLFETYCAVCHGVDGRGDGFNAYNLNPRPHDLTDGDYLSALSDGALKEAITQGGRGVNKSILMPAYGRTLSERGIEAIVSYIRTLADSAGPGRDNDRHGN